MSTKSTSSFFFKANAYTRLFKKWIFTLGILVAFSLIGKAQETVISSNQTILSNTTYNGFEMSAGIVVIVPSGVTLTIVSNSSTPFTPLGGAILEVQNGGTVDFSSGIYVSAYNGSANPNGEILIQSGGLVTSNGEVNVQGGSLSIVNSGTFTINNSSGTAINTNGSSFLNFSGTGANIINGNMTIEYGSTLTVNSGVTLTVTGTASDNYGGSIIDNGLIAVTGSYTQYSGSSITGSGDITTTQGMDANSSTILGNPNFNCTSNCDGRCGGSGPIITYSSVAFCNTTTSAQSVSLTGPSGGTYAASPSGLSINSSTGAITPSASTPGTYTITYTAPSGTCIVGNTIITISGITNPSTAAACYSLNASATALSVTATGTPAYQWYSNSTNSNSGGISLGSSSGAQTASYTPSTSVASTLYYYCTATLGSCISTSNTSGLITVQSATGPTVTATPASQTICSGGTTSIALSSSTSGVTFSWASPIQTNVSGGTASSGTPTSIIQALTASSSSPNTASYSVIATTSCGVSGSPTIVTITVSPSTQISSQSTSSASYCVNGTATPLSITATGAGITYQWYSNVSASNNGGSLISGGTSANYTPLTTGAGTTYYYCVVSSTCSSPITSSISGAVNIYSPVSQTISGSSPLCTSIPSTYTSTTGGGSWTSSAPSVATVNSSTGVVTGVTAGSSLISYSVTTSGGCVNTASATVTITRCNYSWIGVTSTDWATTSNWNTNILPTSNDSVIIPSGVPFLPIISSIANTAKITVDSLASITLASSGILNAYADVVNNGTFSTVSGSTLAFQGNSSQTLSGKASLSLYNLKVNNAAGLSITTPVIVNGTISLTSGVVTSNNNLTIDFDNGGNIAYSVTDTGSISGTVSGARSFSTGSHYMSSPFSGVTVNQIETYTPVYSNGYWKMYTKTFTTQGWAAVTSLSTPLTLGEGFSLSVPNQVSIYLSGSYTHDLTVNSPSYSNTIANQYFMFGNPYPSTIDWDNTSGWSNSNIGGAIYYWKPETNTVASYVSGVGTNGGTNEIPAMQAFMVATTGTVGSSSISVNPLSRTTSNSSFFRTASYPIVSFEVETATGAFDQTIIRFNDQASPDYEPAIDALKVMNPSIVPSLYTNTITSNTNLSINNRPMLNPGEVIPLNLKVIVNGTYTIRCSQYNVPGYQLLLEDNVTHTLTPVDTSLRLSINALASDNTDRFTLRLASVAITTPILQSINAGKGLKIYTSPNGFIVNTDNLNAGIATIQILDAAGRQLRILNDITLQPGNNFYSLDDLASGVYLVRINTSSGTYVQQVSVLSY